MSERTLQKRLSERRSMRQKGSQNKNENAPMVSADLESNSTSENASESASAGLQRSTRLGSARNMANKMLQSGFRRLMKRSATFDQLSFPRAELRTAIQKGQGAQSKSTSNAAIAELGDDDAKCDSFYSPTPPAVEPPIQTAAKACRPSSSSNHACDCAHSAHHEDASDNELANEEQEVTLTRVESHRYLPSPPPPIRLRSPGPLASPDARMLYMTVDELLTTEVKYVQAMQYVLKVRNDRSPLRK